MAEIKRIQLRGISHAPSDRMTEDGGVAESVNLSLENSELAPIEAPIIQDVVVGGEDFYIHKTSQYTHYIGVTNRHVYYAVGDTQKRIIDLPSTAQVLDFGSTGNALVIITTAGPYYFLWKDGAYQVLGSGLPTPDIEITTQFESQYSDYATETITGDGNTQFNGILWRTPIGHDGEYWWPQIPEFPTSLEWNNGASDVDKQYNKKQTLALFQDKVDLTDSTILSGKYAYPVFVRYALEMFDGQLLSCPPILCGVGEKELLNLHIEVDTVWDAEAGIPHEMLNSFAFQYKPYRIYAQLKNLNEIQEYADLIKGVNFYMSPVVGNPGYIYHDTTMVERAEVKSEEDELWRSHIVADVRYNLRYTNLESRLLDCSGKMRKVTTISFDALSKGTTIFSTLPFNETELLEKEHLAGEIMANNPIVPGGIFSYNNRMIYTQPSILYTYGMSSLNSSKAAKENQTITYECTWVIRNQGSRNVVVTQTFATSNKIYGFQTFPNRMCTEMWVKMSGEKEKTLFCEMKPHPTLNCSYCYIVDGLTTALYESTQAAYNANDIPQGIATVAQEAQIRVSEINNPFVFPPEGTFQFQSRVIGVATTGTPLSQGQFGQHPLLVFTEDGIWAMSVDAKGDFVTNLPAARAVCNNASSITGTEKGVVFTTDAGVMLYANGNLTNLSLNMMRHNYIQLCGSTNVLIQSNSDKDRIPRDLQDIERFQLFIRNCSIAYDASGDRLILVSKKYPTHQYVYCFLTGTWHRVYNRRVLLKRVLNSYPECLCYGELVTSEHQNPDGYVTQTTDKCVFNLSASAIAEKTANPQQGIIVTRPMDLGEPDVFKVVTDVRVRGSYLKGTVKFILEGSNDGVNFYTLNSLRGKAWKLFRLIILGNMDRHDRISWVDIMYETKFTNKLR